MPGCPGQCTRLHSAVTQQFASENLPGQVKIRKRLASCKDVHLVVAAGHHLEVGQAHCDRYDPLTPSLDRNISTMLLDNGLDNSNPPPACNRLPIRQPPFIASPHSSSLSRHLSGL